MSKHIHIMSSTLANQIAAGEVIERPASVVKELVENAIDARSTRIEVFVEEAGLKRIQVVDDGVGISSDDVLDAFQRHATSKLLSDDELFRIRTLGFRGEALPSIASVSRLTLETAEENQPGRKVVLNGGEVIENQAAASRRGVNITVEELFYNTPARLKYVKTLKTELSHISDTVNRLALAHPEIAFKLVSDGTVISKTVGNKDQIQAIAGIYGVETAKKMKKIEKANFDFEVSGYVSLPETTRASNNYMTLIVNGRYIKNFILNRAIVDGYGSTLMVGRYPVAVINVNMDPLLLDVNVHPTKQQIRISNEKELAQLISEAIKERMAGESRIPNAWESFQTRPAKRMPAPKDEQTRLSFEQSKLEPVSSDYLPNHQPTSDYLNETSEVTTSHPPVQSVAKETDFVDNNHVAPVLKTALNQTEEETNSRPFPDLDYIGQMHGTYLFAQNESGLYIIDQHAAQERIKYEYYKSAIAEDGTDLQELLVPIVIDYPSSDAMIIKDNKEKLEDASVFLEDFGQNSFLIRRHPTWMLAGQVEDTIKEMIDFFLEKSSLSVSQFREATAIMMSCKRSIKANHYLSNQEARALLNQLSEARNPYNCPHGRPVLVNFTTTDMEKMFKRIQDSH
ncbi:DNA mismatch repair endonuclease MutL [Alkalibacterium sp. MB6]|uniref:DNA mismatch repair endonuclease MutL n=1 Tax=Alkalibacterium sp. MB6 TaxID=2081965 RepID=UPI002351B56D|nr:DNA mismatch repair endonuclease MutL [Alkalibacterium sp. MB6]